MPSIRNKRRKLTVISWDICRNHFSKAYNICEALKDEYDVQLIGFRFFETDIFEPYKGTVAPFKTLFLDGASFPEFKQNLAVALNSIEGDIVYCVKPRLTSYGLGLLANYNYGKPVVLEFNDLETVVANPQSDKKSSTTEQSVALNDQNLKVPYAREWSLLLEKIAKLEEFTTTHNINLDTFFGGKSFYIRNLKDETYFNPDLYDRDALRTQYGFGKEDRVILFGGMLRKHKGIYQLIDIMKILGTQYKVLFVGSRVTPDQTKLEQEYGDMVTILPPQGRNDMAKLNYLSDLVILWLDPKIPASHYQMPYKFTDAIAMKVPVISNDISDLGELAREGYLRLVDYEDYNGLKKIVDQLFNEEDQRTLMVDRARLLYLRQFSYKAVKSNMDLIFDTALSKAGNTSDSAKEFAHVFNEFLNHLES